MSWIRLFIKPFIMYYLWTGWKARANVFIFRRLWIGGSRWEMIGLSFSYKEALSLWYSYEIITSRTIISQPSPLPTKPSFDLLCVTGLLINYDVHLSSTGFKLDYFISFFPLQSSVRGENITIFGCLNHGMPLSLHDNTSVSCESGKTVYDHIWDFLSYVVVILTLPFCEKVWNMNKKSAKILW